MVEAGGIATKEGANISIQSVLRYSHTLFSNLWFHSINRATNSTLVYTSNNIEWDAYIRQSNDFHGLMTTVVLVPERDSLKFIN